MIDHAQAQDGLVQLALRELSPEREQELQQHLQDCPECRQTLRDVRSSLALVALSASGPRPPQRSRERLIKALSLEPRGLRAYPARPRWWALAPVFAAAVLAVFSLLLLVQLFEQYRVTQALRQESSEKSRSLAGAQDMLMALTSPNTQRVTLVAANARPQPQGRVFYHRSSGRLLFFASRFDPLQKGKVYQLWLIPMNDHAPMPAGTFRPDENGSGSIMMPPMPRDIEAKAFAITIEPEGGSQTPTMPIQMLGS